MTENGPIFIAGADRSGKTYMRMMLEAHPNIAFSKRTNLWTRYYEQFGSLAQAGNLERCLKALLQNKHVQTLQPDLPQLLQQFRAGEPTYGRLFSLLHEQYLSQLGKARWGDQTEFVEAIADAIFAAYPNACFIHMIRDPRDRYEAAVSRKPEERGKVGYATAQWRYSAALARRNQPKYANQYHIVRYETMVHQPEQTMRTVCDFLDEIYTPALVALTHVPRFQTENGRSSTSPSPLSPGYIGRFRKGLAADEIAFIQQYAGREMRHFGYTLEPIHVSPTVKLQLSLDGWFPNVVRMTSWRALLSLHAALARS